MACCMTSRAGDTAKASRSARRSTGYGIQEYVQRVQHLAMIVIICVVVWAATGGAFWPAWVMLGAGISLVRRTYMTFVLPTRGGFST
ncbi:MAG TPA: hypothetical protein VGR90_01215 [Acidimicrobiales bacterium]|nr:hypothetical protein [Acidimicrobiales bacterium]